MLEFKWKDKGELDCKLAAPFHAYNNSLHQCSQLMFPQTKLVTTTACPHDRGLLQKPVELGGESPTKCSGLWIGPELLLRKLSTYTAQDLHLHLHFSKRLNSTGAAIPPLFS